MAFGVKLKDEATGLITSFLRNIATQARTYTLPDKDGTVALENIDTVAITAATVLDDTAFGKLHLCTGTSADYNLTLPTLGATNYGKTIAIKAGTTVTLTKIVSLIGTIDGETDTRKIGSNGYFLLESTSSGYVVLNEIGSWIPWATTQTGYSANPTIGDSKYFRVAKKCNFQYNETGNGTSNATTKTITLPFNSKNANGIAPIVLTSSGAIATTPGTAQTRASSNVLDLFRTWANASGAWAADGTGARINRLWLEYEIE
jgi:hypothetical protein